MKKTETFVIRKGECTRCGKCCMGIHLMKVLQHLEEIAKRRGVVFDVETQRSLKELKNSYQAFLELPPEVRKNLKAWCPYLKKEKNGKFSCTIYKNRFIFCELFPQSPEEITDIPECGYYFVDATGKRVN